MQRLSIVAFALTASLALASVSHATNFAVLLTSPDEPECVVVNPLFEGSGTNGVNPLHSVRALVFNPAELWQGAPATLEVLFDDGLPTNPISRLPAAPAGALVFGVSLTDQASGNAIHQLLNQVTLAIEFDAAVNPADYIFSSLNESTDVWGEFQKGKTKEDRNNQVCGYTNHFSYFYIAAVPEPSAFALATLAGGLGLALRRAGAARRIAP